RQGKPMGMMKAVYGMLLASSLVLALAACSILPRNEPVVIDRYTLETTAWPTREAGLGAPVLLVTRPLARVELDTPRMAYRKQDYQLRYFARSRWADIPAQLLLPGLVEALEASGHFGAVVRVGSAARPDLRLDVELLEFSQDFRVTPSEFQLRLRLQLVDLETRAVLASRLFSTHAAAPERSPRGVAAAANAAWQTLLPELVAFCADSLAGR
ncbi:MAG TPA: ABC-type transport auxiliary lipoprotein family protein, partial [Gammaproteobacteria bacterium]|nr:ABC-type transport auxiliary lipoprotein family protein [Gammaproteobacteria bacterium]